MIEALRFEEPIAPRRLRPGLPRDLETIVLKALEKEPAKRYSTAALMAEDLRCVLDASPIRAKPPGAFDRLTKLIRRWPALAAVSGVLMVVIIGAFVAITTFWAAAVKARDRADVAAQIAQREKNKERRIRYQAGISGAASALELDHPDEARSLLENLPEEQRNWEWRYLASQLTNSTFVFRASEGPIKAFDLAPGGKMFAFATEGDANVRLCRTDETRDCGRLDGLGSPVTAIAFAPDGTRVAAGSAGGSILVWQVEGHVPIARLSGQTSAIAQLVFDRSASRLIFRDAQSEFQLWHFSENRREPLGQARSAQFSPDGKTVCYGSARELCIRSSTDSRQAARLNLNVADLASAAFSPDGVRFAAGLHFPNVDVKLYSRAWDGPAINLEGHKNTVSSVDFSPDGKRLASGSLDQKARLWDVETGSNLAILRGHLMPVFEVRFVSQGQRLLTRSEDGAIRIWQVSDGELLGSLRGHFGVASCRITRDGNFVGIVDSRGSVRIWDLDRTIRRGVLHGHESFVYDVAIAADGRYLASSSWDRTVRFWDQSNGGGSASSQRLGGFVVSITAAPSAASFATVEHPGIVRFWTPPAMKPVWSVKFQTAGVAEVDGRVAFHPQGRVLALAGGRDLSVQFYATADGALLGALPWNDRPVTDVAFSPQGDLVAAADTGAKVRLWDFATKTPRGVIKAGDRIISRIGFHPRGTMIATVSIGGSVDLWDVATRQHLAVLKHPTRVYGIAFNPNGTRLAAACQDSTIQLWDTTHFERVAQLRGHQAYVHAVTFSADGTRLISGSGDHTIRIWDAPFNGEVSDAVLGLGSRGSGVSYASAHLGD